MMTRLLLLICALLAPIRAFAAEMTPEEATVRTAYAKIAYGSQLEVLVDAAFYSGKRLPDRAGPRLGDSKGIAEAVEARKVSFRLTDCLTGSGTLGLDHARWDSLVSEPDIYYIEAHVQGMDYSVETQHSRTTKPVRWADLVWRTRTAEQLSAASAAQWATPASQVLAGEHYTRYASCRVELSFQGRTASYRALWLFGNNDKGEEVVAAVNDNTVVGAGLFGMEPMYPAAFLETNARDNPDIHDFLIASPMPTACAKKAEPDVCCDPSTGKCGIGKDDLRRSLSFPVDPLAGPFRPRAMEAN